LTSLSCFLSLADLIEPTSSDGMSITKTTLAMVGDEEEQRPETDEDDNEKNEFGLE